MPRHRIEGGGDGRTCSRWVCCRGRGDLIIHPEGLVVICLVLLLLAQDAVPRRRPPLEVIISVLCCPQQPLQDARPSGDA